jgi:hypothetical protein
MHAVESKSSGRSAIIIIIIIIIVWGTILGAEVDTVILAKILLFIAVIFRFYRRYVCVWFPWKRQTDKPYDSNYVRTISETLVTIMFIAATIPH